MVAELFYKIIIEDPDHQQLPYAEVRLLADWMYELCPDEPAFEPLFLALNLY